MDVPRPPFSLSCFILAFLRRVSSCNILYATSVAISMPTFLTTGAIAAASCIAIISYIFNYYKCFFNPSLMFAETLLVLEASASRVAFSQSPPSIRTLASLRATSFRLLRVRNSFSLFSSAPKYTCMPSIPFSLTIFISSAFVFSLATCFSVVRSSICRPFTMDCWRSRFSATRSFMS